MVLRLVVLSTQVPGTTGNGAVEVCGRRQIPFLPAGIERRRSPARAASLLVTTRLPQPRHVSALNAERSAHVRVSARHAHYDCINNLKICTIEKSRVGKAGARRESRLNEPEFTPPIIADFSAAMSSAGAWMDFGKVGSGQAEDAYGPRPQATAEPSPVALVPLLTLFASYQGDAGSRARPFPPTERAWHPLTP